MRGAERACGEFGTPCPGHALATGRAQWLTRATKGAGAAKRAKRGREHASPFLAPGSRVQPEPVRDSDVARLHAAAATNATADVAESRECRRAARTRAPELISCER